MKSEGLVRKSNGDGDDEGEKEMLVKVGNEESHENETDLGDCS